MTPEQKDLLHALAFLYLRHGQNRRALSLMMLAARRVPNDPGLMRTLAFSFIVNDAAEEALEVIDRLEQIDREPAAGPMHWLLKARALLHAGRPDEAKALFRQFVDARNSGIEPLAELATSPDPETPELEVDETRPDHNIYAVTGE